MSSNEKLLEIKNLTINVEQNCTSYPAVSNVSFSIEQEDILGLVGESGCGKSLTALSIEELLSPNIRQASGSIKFYGRELDSLSQKERLAIYGKEIATIFQEPMTSLNPLVKIGKQTGENLLLHTNLKKNQISERVEEVLLEVGFENPKKIMNMYPHELSGGMRQRIMIASAVICRPKLLIADEPTTALDVATQNQVIELLRKINSTYHTAILFISHDLNLIKKLCTKTIVMYAGKIIEKGSTKEITENPAHFYTQGLINSIPSKSKKGLPLECIPGKVPAITEPKYPCPFAPRCQNAHTICFTQIPKEIENDQHSVCCHFAKR